MAREATTTLALGALVVRVAFSGCFTPFWKQEGPLATSYAFFGLPETARLGTSGVFSSAGDLADACFLVDVDDIANRGRVVSDGYLDDESRLVVRMEEFRGPNETRGGGLGINFPAAGTMPNGVRVAPQVPTVIAGWGNATIELGETYLDDIFSGEYNFTAHFLVTQNGFQDDATGAILARDGSLFEPARPTDVRTVEGDWEAHLFVHSHGTNTEFQRTNVFRNRNDANGMILSDESYSREELFLVEWLGGKARFTITVTGTTAVEMAQTSLLFRFFDPFGKELSSTTLAPSGSTEVTEIVEFETKRMGLYTFTVEGPAHLATYRVDMVLEATQPYRLHFSWEEQDPNRPISLFDKCAVSKDRGQPAQGNFLIARPPGISVIILALGVLGAVVSSLLFVKLVLDARTIAAFKASFRRK
jgi:hypothetical protein